MPLGDSHVETAFGHLLHHDAERTPRRHRRGNPYDPFIPPGQFEQRLAEHILIARRGPVSRMSEPFARFGIEQPRSVPGALMLFGRLIPFALHRQYVQQFRPGNLFQILQYAGQLLDVMAVHRPEIAKIEAFEQIALLQETSLEGVAHLLDRSPQFREPLQTGPCMVLGLVISFRCRDVEQVLLQGADIRINRHAVVVEHHQQVRIRRPRIVQSLESEAPGQRSVADHRHHFALLPATGRSDRNTQCRRNRRR